MWAAVPDPAQPARVALGELYDWHRSTEVMIANSSPTGRSFAHSLAGAEWETYQRSAHDVLSAGWGA